MGGGDGSGRGRRRGGSKATQRWGGEGQRWAALLGGRSTRGYSGSGGWSGVGGGDGRGGTGLGRPRRGWPTWKERRGRDGGRGRVQGDRLRRTGSAATTLAGVGGAMWKGRRGYGGGRGATGEGCVAAGYGRRGQRRRRGCGWGGNKSEREWREETEDGGGTAVNVPASLPSANGRQTFFAVRQRTTKRWAWVGYTITGPTNLFAVC